MRTHHIAVAIGFGIAALVGGLLHSFNSLDVEPVPFTPEVWQKLQPDLGASNDPGCVLGGLAKSLNDRRLLTGKPVHFVFEQIGQPNGREGADLVYALGQCHGWGWHDSELVVSVSVEGIVLKTDVRASK